ncbi:MAG: hypothetical protein J3K34DRAFT_527110 [Monoraphidium minutum]|nr:MAG: hypothetical protein J3K34DRAFT_527110 [Monoraphidium minutum]
MQAARSRACGARTCRALALAALVLLEAAVAVHGAGRPQRATIADGGRAAAADGLGERTRGGASARGTSPNAEASMQIAARQPLFDYAVTQGLAILNATLRNTTIDEVRATVEVPLLGGIDVVVRDVNVTSLSVDPDLARVAIEAGFYHAAAANVTANITFGWAWSKGPLGGSGEGELFLEGGGLDMVFLVRNQEGGAPQLVPVSSGIAFEDLRLSVKAASADWLYQALLYVFQGAVRRNIEAAMDDALRTAVPASVNDLLGSLPSSVAIQGLPFSAVFTYAVYTLSYVVVKGFAEVDAPDPEPSPSLAAAPAPAAPATLPGAACPFPATPLPLPPAAIGGEPHMVSLYAHESVLNCVSWALFHAGALTTRVEDGQLPGLRLITDLFGALMPDLPAAYPRHGLALDIVLSEPPAVAFGAGGGVAPSRRRSLPGGVADGPKGDDVLVSLRYTTAVSVLNASADGSGAPLQVARLAANLSVTADFGWSQTSVSAVDVSYALLEATTGVAPEAWNKAIDWVVRQAGAKLALSRIWDDYVVAPGRPFFALENVVAASAGDAWRGLSADVRVTAGPAAAAAARAAAGGGGGAAARSVPLWPGQREGRRL